jgi:hypothetical protein
MKTRKMRQFAVWLVRFDNWLPRSWNECPPRAVVLEPADDELMSADEAAGFIEGYNDTILRRSESTWAVPIAMHDLEGLARGTILPPGIVAREPMVVPSSVGTGDELLLS